MAIYGSLLTMPLADVLMWIRTARRAGRLIVHRDGHDWELWVEGGTVKSYEGPELRDQLGHILVMSGLLTEEDLRKAIQHQRERGGSLQAAMIDLKQLTPQQLQECLRELATESIFDLFIDVPGDFVFSDERDIGLGAELEGERDTLPLELDVNHLLMEGAHRQDDWTRVSDRFGDASVGVTIDYEKLPPLETMGVRERRILASLAAGQSLSDICFELRTPVLSVLRILVDLEEQGAVALQAIESDRAEDDVNRYEDLIRQAKILREAGQYDEAASLLEVAVQMRPDADDARAELRSALEEQLRALYASIPPFKVPRLAADPRTLQSMHLSSGERFLLERLNANMDVGSLIMVSSLNERDTLKCLRKLIHSGVVEL